MGRVSSASSPSLSGTACVERASASDAQTFRRHQELFAFSSLVVNLMLIDIDLVEGLLGTKTGTGEYFNA